MTFESQKDVRLVIIHEHNSFPLIADFTFTPSSFPYSPLQKLTQAHHTFSQPPSLIFFLDIKIDIHIHICQNVWNPRCYPRQPVEQRRCL